MDLAEQAEQADAALLIWLHIDPSADGRFIARLTATRGLAVEPYSRRHASDIDAVCDLVRDWLEAELARTGTSAD